MKQLYILLTSLLVFLLVQCDSLREPESPKARSDRQGAVVFDHSEVSTDTCVACHESRRPGGSHPQTEDCADCHTYPSFSEVKILRFTHTDAIKSCSYCHEPDRPTYPHLQNGDCITCHTRPTFSGVDLTKLNFTHDPMPDSCNLCHSQDRPKRETHSQKGDCVACHTRPAWNKEQTNFEHTDSLESCIQCHEGERKSEDHYPGVDCVKCHTNPDFSKIHWTHTPKPETCETCHTRPTETGKTAYPNQGPPPEYKEDGTYPGSGHYFGKDCSSCHNTPAEGSAVFKFTHSSPNPEVCLPCHFNKGEDKHGTKSPSFQMSEFGNCYNCHKGFSEQTFDRK